ncbi:putative NADH-ubiquinone/plastoquinone oxidoreductase [Pseudomonas aeruginosa]|nr:putative NADH-ubiquinone/plastoquinone oxidoreductase [Pseudomonas aeruginosa]
MYASFAPATWALLAYLFGALALCLLMLGLGRVLGGRSHGRAKNLPFESGVDSTGSSRLRFSVKYALVAMLFVIFGIEMPFLYLWAVSLRENGWAGFVEATLFVSLLLVGLFYLHRVGALRLVAGAPTEKAARLVVEDHQQVAAGLPGGGEGHRAVDAEVQAVAALQVERLLAVIHPQRTLDQPQALP